MLFTQLFALWASLFAFFIIGFRNLARLLAISTHHYNTTFNDFMTRNQNSKGNNNHAEIGKSWDRTFGGRPFATGDT